MIVVAILALLAMLAVPGFLRVKKRSQAGRILQDLRSIDSATDQYALDTGRYSGFKPRFSDIKGYLKAGTSLYETRRDVLGNRYALPPIDVLPSIPAASYEDLSEVAPLEFWKPFQPAGPDAEDADPL